MTNNPAFDAACEGGVIDTFLSLPKPKEALRDSYSWVTANAMDKESKEMDMPAEYMFKGVPKYEEITDPVDMALAEMDRFNISKMLIGVDRTEGAKRAYVEHPDRFFGFANVDPNTGMEGVRSLEERVKEFGLKCAHVFPAGLVPPVAINDKKMYPLYAKCVELNIPIVTYVGVPGPRIPMDTQQVAMLDEVCWFFPELKIITRHGGEPWTALMVKLLLKWPNLYYSTSAFSPKHYPQDIIDFANTRGADKILYAGYYAAGLSLERIFSELPDVPFRDHVWPKFLRENAQRVFELD
ncbi:MAG: amidohydrolase family protein [Acidimicrobiia bacterium]